MLPCAHNITSGTEMASGDSPVEDFILWKINNYLRCLTEKLDVALDVMNGWMENGMLEEFI